MLKSVRALVYLALLLKKKQQQTQFTKAFKTIIVSLMIIGFNLKNKRKYRAVIEAKWKKIT